MTTDAVKAALSRQEIELPSWAFGNSGTRFKVFGQPGVARDPFEKLEDAAQVHKYTGVAPRVSLHIPWDLVDDFGKLGSYTVEKDGEVVLGPLKVFDKSNVDQFSF